MSIDSETAKVIATFLDETREAFQEIEPALVELESLLGTADATPVINSIFGIYHSVKGSAGLLEFHEIERVTHAAEAVLQRVRDGDLELDESLVDLFCKGLDFVSERLDAIEQTHSDLGAETIADDLVTKFCVFAPEIDEDRPEPAILLFIEDDIVFVEDDGTGEVIDDPPELRSAAGEAPEHFASEEETSLEVFAGQGTLQLDECAAALHRIEQGEWDTSIIHEMWSALHTFQTASGNLRLHELQLLAQAVQSVCEQLRVELAVPDPDRAQVKDVCSRIRSGLESMREGVLGSLAVGGSPLSGLDERVSEVLGHTRSSAPRLGEILLQAQLISPDALEQAIERQQQRPKLGEVLLEMEAVDPDALDAALEAQEHVREGKEAPPLPSKTQRHETLRVDVEKVDRLMDLVGEMIIGVTSVVHHPAVQELGSDGFEKSAAQLTRITRDMQDVAMSLRMVPVRNAFRKMKRLVRDLSKKMGKQVRLEITGDETEVDKSVAEVIADPLVHLVRNALDHGLEPPEERIAAGKPPEGIVHITARHQGGEVWIEIIDNGRGIDRNKVYQRARERGITSTPLDDLSDREVNNFIFEPGLSTAAQVSEVSGRGMGMDVVKRNIESVNGRIEVDSTPGEGSRIALRIPLTLAIIEGMLVRVGQSCFTIPLLQIKESMVVPTNDVTILSNGQEIVKIREQLLPLVRMHRFYDIQSDSDEVGRGIVMVVEDAGAPLCLFVDELIGQRQTVIKGLSGYLRAIRGLSGCTVLGDGRISFILDVASLRSHAVAQGVA